MGKRHEKMDQLHTTMKSHGLNPDFAKVDFDLGEKELLPPKYQFPSIKKYYGTNNPHFYLKQYVTYMTKIGLSKAQSVK